MSNAWFENALDDDGVEEFGAAPAAAPPTATDLSPQHARPPSGRWFEDALEADVGPSPRLQRGAAIESAMATTPQIANENAQVAKSLGVPRSAVDGSPDAARQKSMREGLRVLMDFIEKDQPRLSKWLETDNNLAMTRDDLNPIKAVVDYMTGGGIGESLQAGEVPIEFSHYDKEYRKEYAKSFRTGEPMPEWTVSLRERMKAAGVPYQEHGRSFIGDAAQMFPIIRDVGTGAATAATIGVGGLLAAGYAAGSPVTVPATLLVGSGFAIAGSTIRMSQIEGANYYMTGSQEPDDDGNLQSPESLELGANIYMSIAAALENASFALGILGPAKNALMSSKRLAMRKVQDIMRDPVKAIAALGLKDWIAATIIEMVQEGSQAFTEVVIDEVSRLLSNEWFPEQTIADTAKAIWARMGEVFEQGLAAGPAAVLMGGFGPSVSTSKAVYGRDTLRADADYKHLENLAKLKQDSTFIQENPDEAQEMIEEALPDNSEVILIDGRGLPQDEAEALIEAVPSVTAEKVAQARAEGTSLEVGTAEYVTRMAGTELETRLAPHMKRSYDTRSRAELDSDAKIVTRLVDEVREKEKESEQEIAPENTIDALTAQYVEQLTESGMFSRTEDIQAMAEMMALGDSNVAKMLGLSPETALGRTRAVGPRAKVMQAPNPRPAVDPLEANIGLVLNRLRATGEIPLPDLPRTPVQSFLKARGVAVGSPLAAELTARGILINPRDGGLTDADAIPLSEVPFLAGEEGYADPADILAALDEEISGRPRLTDEQGEVLARAQEFGGQIVQRMEALGIDLQSMSNEAATRLILEDGFSDVSVADAVDPFGFAGEPFEQPAPPRDASSPARVSTRNPTGVNRAQNPLAEHLEVGLAALEESGPAHERNVEAVRNYVNMPQVDGETDAATAARFIEHVKENLLWLLDSVPASIQARSKRWYDGARNIVDKWSDRYDQPHEVIAGIIAAQSPQTDWFVNVSRAERIIDAWTYEQDTAWTDEMDAAVARIPAMAKEEQALALTRGLTLREAAENGDFFAGFWIRAFDEAHNSQSYRILSPEGESLGFAEKKAGGAKKHGWGTFGQLANSVSMLRDPSRENIHHNLGVQHKIRSFYNNILSPEAGGDITIDTHAVAAALLRPLSGLSPEVSHNLGGTGSASSIGTGIKGTYALYAEAYRIAAEERGLLPRELQSITWEAVRGMYTDVNKRDRAFLATIQSVWEEYHGGKITVEQARERVHDAAGGIADPSWVGLDTESDGDAGATTYEGVVLESFQSGTRSDEATAARVGVGATRGSAAEGGGGRGLRLDQPPPPASPAAPGPRAQFGWMLDGAALIQIFEGGDPTSVLHESAHKWLDLMAKYVQGENASPALVEDFAALQQWWSDDAATIYAWLVDQSKKKGSKITEADIAALDAAGGAAFIRSQAEAGALDASTGNVAADVAARGMHEHTARGFELYLYEAKAPSKRLKSAFDTMKLWVEAIYKQAKEQLGVELTPEVTAVFDHWLASKEEIAEAAQGSGELAHLAEAKGLSPARAAALADRAEEAVFEAEARVRRLKFAEARRIANALRSEHREEVEAEVFAELEADPLYRADSFVRGKWLGEPVEGDLHPERLSKAAILDAYADGKALLKKIQGRYRKEGGIHPDDLAVISGYEGDGLALVTALGDITPLKEKLKQETDRRLIERFGTAEEQAVETAEDILASTEAGRLLIEEQLAEIRREGTPALEEAVSRRVAEEGAGSSESDRLAVQAAEVRVEAARTAGDDAATQAAILDLEEARAALKPSKQERRSTAARGRLGDAVSRSVRAQSKVLDAAARERIEVETKVRDIKPQKYRQAADRAGRDADRALARRDYDAAEEAQVRRLFNTHMHRHALAAQQTVAKSRRYDAKFDRKPIRTRLANTGHLEAIDEVRAKVSFKNVSLRELDRQAVIVGGLQVASQNWEGAGFSINGIDQRIVESMTVRNYKDLTMDEIAGTIDTLKNIDHLSRHWDKIGKEEDRIRFDELMDGLVSSILKNSATPTAENNPGLENQNRNALQKGLSYVFASDAMMVKMLTLLFWLDGGGFGRRTIGPVLKAIHRPLADSQTRESDMQEALTEKLVGIFAALPKAQRERLGKWVDVPEIGRRMKYKDLISLGLNSGAVLNWRRLTGRKNKAGEHIGWTEAEVNQALARLDEADWDLIRGIWGVFDELWPVIVQNEVELTNVAPIKRETRTVFTKWGSFEGGYYPLMYDEQRSPRAESLKQMDNASALHGSDHTRPHTRNGHVKDALEHLNREVALDLDRIYMHLNQVLHDVTHRGTILDVYRIVSDQRFKDAVSATMGPEYTAMFEPWLRRVANGRIVETHPILGPIEAVLRETRIRFSFGAMAYKVSVILQQPAGAVQSLAYLGPKWFAFGWYEWLKDVRGQWDFAHALGAELAHRANTMDRDYRANLAKFEGKTGLTAIAGRHAFTAHALTDKAVSVPTWLGAYHEAMEEHGDPIEAAYSGDIAVIQTQGAGADKDLSAIQGGNEFLRMWTLFMGFMSQQYQLYRTAGRDMTKAISEKDIARIAYMTYIMILLTTVSNVLAELMAGRPPEDDEDFAQWIADTTLRGIFGVVPFGRELADRALFGGYKAGVPPFVEIGEVAVSAAAAPVKLLIDEDADSDELISDFLTGVGYAKKLPVGQARILMRAMDKAWEGEDPWVRDFFLYPPKERR